MAFLSFVPSGMTAPGRATATVWPAATFGAPQTICAGSSSPTSTVQTRQPVGVRVLLGGQHPADDEVLERADAVAVDALDLGAGHRQALAELARRRCSGSQYSRSQLSGTPQPNCSRKRRSLS